MAWISKAEHDKNFESLAAILRQPRVTNEEKLDNYNRDPDNHINDYLEMSDGGWLVHSTKSLHDLTREEAITTLVGVSKTRATNREALMGEIMRRPDIQGNHDVWRKAHGSQLGVVGKIDINATELLNLANLPKKSGNVVEHSQGGNQLQIDSSGVSAVFGEAELKHWSGPGLDKGLARALRFAVNGNKMGLMGVMGSYPGLKRQYGEKLEEIRRGLITVDPQTMSVLGLSKPASSTLIDGNTGKVIDESDPYSGQFSSDDWIKW